MSGLSHLAMQKAIYETLTEDSGLMAKVSGVYDYVPEGVAYPYITIGDIAASDWSTKTSSGTQMTIDLHVHSQKNGRKETIGLIEDLYTLLHQGGLTVAGHNLIAIRYESDQVQLDRNGINYRGTVRFRAYTEASA